jgi:hypothetical protein
MVVGDFFFHNMTNRTFGKVFVTIYRNLSLIICYNNTTLSSNYTLNNI